ncbi:MAG: hypothetical protein ABL997_15160 [Planctomycetota bacterium]
MTRRTDKHLAHLDAREADFRAELVLRLRSCAAGLGTLLFVVPVMRTETFFQRALPDSGEGLFDAASAIVALRSQLGLDPEDCLAARYVAACRRDADRSEHHKPGPRQLAAQMLQELGESG